MGRPKVRNDDLRSQILDAAVDIVRSDGTQALTTRRLARGADASLAAIAELFGGRSGVVRDVAGAGFRRLASVTVAVPPSTDPSSELAAVAQAFRSFVRDEPHLFEVMFSRPLSELDPGPVGRSAAAALRADIVGRVARLLDVEPSDPAATDAALGLVALTRGLAAQELAGILGSTDASSSRRWSSAVTTHLSGLIHQRDTRTSR